MTAAGLNALLTTKREKEGKMKRGARRRKKEDERERFAKRETFDGIEGRNFESVRDPYGISNATLWSPSTTRDVRQRCLCNNRVDILLSRHRDRKYFLCEYGYIFRNEKIFSRLYRMRKKEKKRRRKKEKCIRCLKLISRKPIC